MKKIDILIERQMGLTFQDFVDKEVDMMFLENMGDLLK